MQLNVVGVGDGSDPVLAVLRPGVRLSPDEQQVIQAAWQQLREEDPEVPPAVILPGPTWEISFLQRNHDGTYSAVCPAAGPTADAESYYSK
jgi:hypothetical protein